LVHDCSGDKNGWLPPVSHERVGDVLLAEGKLAEALQAYRDCLAIRERLAEANPVNAGWQYGLSVSHGKLAETYLRLGQAPDANIELRKGREIMARVVDIAPGNAQWWKDLTWFDDQIARLQQ
jgi:hypothetical protein